MIFHLAVDKAFREAFYITIPHSFGIGLTDFGSFRLELSTSVLVWPMKDAASRKRTACEPYVCFLLCQTTDE
jgi:hypothetical protein